MVSFSTLNHIKYFKSKFFWSSLKENSSKSERNEIFRLCIPKTRQYQLSGRTIQLSWYLNFKYQDNFFLRLFRLLSTVHGPSRFQYQPYISNWLVIKNFVLFKMKLGKIVSRKLITRIYNGKV